MKRTLAVLVVTVLAALIAVAAFAQTAKTPVTLSIIANQDWVTKPYMKAAWANYENVTGNKLDIQALPIDNWETVMKTRAAAGELPDIVMTFAGPVLDAMRPAENFFDLSNEPFVKDLKPFVLPQVTYKGKIYGLPLWEGSVSGTLYNKDIFKKLSISVPKTQAEFWAACETIKKAGITPIYLAFKDIWPALPQFGLDPIAKKYPGFVDKLNSNKLTFAGVPEITNLVGFYKTLVDKGYLGADFVSNTWDGQAKALGEGTYAMALAWDQYLYSDLEPRYAGAAAHFGIMPFFMDVAPEGSYEGPNACMTLRQQEGQERARKPSSSSASWPSPRTSTSPTRTSSPRATSRA